jgi:hypothetical protein
MNIEDQQMMNLADEIENLFQLEIQLSSELRSMRKLLKEQRRLRGALEMARQGHTMFVSFQMQ